MLEGAVCWDVLGASAVKQSDWQRTNPLPGLSDSIEVQLSLQTDSFSVVLGLCVKEGSVLVLCMAETGMSGIMQSPACSHRFPKMCSRHLGPASGYRAGDC